MTTGTFSQMHKSFYLINGNSNSGMCGVEDYTTNLYKKIKHSSKKIKKEILPSLSSWIYFVKKVNPDDVIIFQYPTLTLRYSLTPFIFIPLLRLRGCKVITYFHEISRLNIIKRFLSFLIIAFSNLLLFSNEKDLKYVRHFFKNKPLKIIPIASNIKSETLKNPQGKEGNLITFFGILAPNKGVEEFIKLAEYLKQNINDLKFRIIGSTPKAYKTWMQNLEIPVFIELLTNKSNKEVFQLLSSSSYAILPYPDGVSDRRGSFLACLEAGLSIFTTEGTETNQAIRDVCYTYKTDDEILNAIQNGHRIDKIKIKKFLNQRSWESISKEYLDIINDI